MKCDTSVKSAPNSLLTRHVYISLHTDLAAVEHAAEGQFFPVPAAARSKTYVCGRSPAEIVGSKPTGGMDACLL